MFTPQRSFDKLKGRYQYKDSYQCGNILSEKPQPMSNTRFLQESPFLTLVCTVSHVDNDLISSAKASEQPHSFNCYGTKEDHPMKNNDNVNSKIHFWGKCNNPQWSILLPEDNTHTLHFTFDYQLHTSTMGNTTLVNEVIGCILPPTLIQKIPNQDPNTKNEIIIEIEAFALDPLTPQLSNPFPLFTHWKSNSNRKWTLDHVLFSVSEEFQTMLRWKLEKSLSQFSTN